MAVDAVLSSNTHLIASRIQCEQQTDTFKDLQSDIFRLFTMAVASPMLPKPVAPLQKKVTKPTKQLPRSLTDSAVLKERIDFDATRHIVYRSAPKITTMRDIGYEGRGISPVAVSEPFPLFTEDAIYQMRAEAFTQGVLDNCQVSSNFASNMIRDYSPKYIFVVLYAAGH